MPQIRKSFVRELESDFPCFIYPNAMDEIYDLIVFCNTVKNSKLNEGIVKKIKQVVTMQLENVSIAKDVEEKLDKGRVKLYKLQDGIDALRAEIDAIKAIVYDDSFDSGKNGMRIALLENAIIEHEDALAEFEAELEECERELEKINYRIEKTKDMIMTLLKSDTEE